MNHQSRAESLSSLRFDQSFDSTRVVLKTPYDDVLDHRCWCWLIAVCWLRHSRVVLEFWVTKTSCVQLAFRGHAFASWEQKTPTSASTSFTHPLMLGLSVWTSPVPHLTASWCPGGPAITVNGSRDEHRSPMQVGAVAESWTSSLRDRVPPGLPGFPAASGGVGDGLPALPLPPESHSASFARSHGERDLDHVAGPPFAC